MSLDHLDSDQIILLTPVSSAGIETPVATGQLVVTTQVPTQAPTYINANVTNPFINGTNQDAGGCPTCHDWVWF